MADESDYTKMWSGVFTPPRIGDDDRGIYLLDDEESVGRNTGIYDESTRLLYDEAHPRTYLGGQRYPGPYGGGRASDKIGPTLDERRRADRRRNARFAGEGFSPSPGEHSRQFEQDRDLYIKGSRRLGHPGFRGMITSSREGRPAVDDVVWDNRPPHYADDTPNKYAHLYIDPTARGPPLFRKDTTYPGFRQVDKFSKGPGGRLAFSLKDSLAIVRAVLFIVIILLVATWLMVNYSVSRSEKRLGKELESAIKEAISAQKV
jgi:hypothetical protein